MLRFAMTRRLRSLSMLAVGISVLCTALLLMSCRSEETSITDTVPIIPASAALRPLRNRVDLGSLSC